MEIFSLVDVNLLLKIVLAIIMYSVGLSLQVQDFRYVVDNKQLLLLGLALKVILMPFLGFVLLSLTTLDSVYKFGIMILLFSAGGTTSNVITYWYKGTSALTVFLTTISSLLAVFLIPVLVNLMSIIYFGAGTDFSLPIFETVMSVVLIIILPALLGLWTNEQFSVVAKRIEKVIKPLSVSLLAVVFLIKFLAPASAGGTELRWPDLLLLTPVLVLINALLMVAGYSVCRWRRLSYQDSMTIGIEMGLQNAGLAILVGGVFIGNEELVKPSLIYAMFSFWTAMFFAYLVKNRYYEKSWN